MTAPDHDYGPAVERLVLIHNGQPLPLLTRLRLAATRSDLARAYRQAQALDRLTRLNAGPKVSREHRRRRRRLRHRTPRTPGRHRTRTSRKRTH